MNIIRIKCPICGAELDVYDDPANVKKSVKCPNCNEKNKFTAFKLVSPAKEASPVPPSGNQKPQQEPDEAEKTQIKTKKKPNVDPGFFKDEATGMRYDIPDGSSTLGRKTTKTPSKADVPISTSDQYMSRVHMKVQAAIGKDGLYHVYVSNAENKNPTFINGNELKGDDVLGIKHGDKLQLGDTVLVYSSSSTDQTDKTELHFKK